LGGGFRQGGSGVGGYGGGAGVELEPDLLNPVKFSNIDNGAIQILDGKGADGQMGDGLFGGGGGGGYGGGASGMSARDYDVGLGGGGGGSYAAKSDRVFVLPEFFGHAGIAFAIPGCPCYAGQEVDTAGSGYIVSLCEDQTPAPDDVFFAGIQFDNGAFFAVESEGPAQEWSCLSSDSPSILISMDQANACRETLTQSATWAETGCGCPCYTREKVNNLGVNRQQPQCGRAL
jgi:hypothetical protein